MKVNDRPAFDYRSIVDPPESPKMSPLGLNPQASNPQNPLVFEVLIHSKIRKLQ